MRISRAEEKVNPNPIDLNPKSSKGIDEIIRDIIRQKMRDGELNTVDISSHADGDGNRNGHGHSNNDDDVLSRGVTSIAYPRDYLDCLEKDTRYKQSDHFRVLEKELMARVTKLCEKIPPEVMYPIFSKIAMHMHFGKKSLIQIDVDKLIGPRDTEAKEAMKAIFAEMEKDPLIKVEIAMQSAKVENIIQKVIGEADKRRDDAKPNPKYKQRGGAGDAAEPNPGPKPGPGYQEGNLIEKYLRDKQGRGGR